MTRHAGEGPAAPARLNEVDCWIFDLDNTLYPAESDLFAQIDVRMSEFVSDALGVDRAAARKLQKHYFRAYGTTMRGLRLNHDIAPEAFLNYVHDIDYSALAPAPLLGEALAMLPGRKLVFTNGSARHAERVLDRLGVTGRFESVFDIAAADYVPKPFDYAYARLIERHGVRPKSAAFFEDSLANLMAARDMTRVWLRNGRDPASPGAERVDHVVDRLDRWLHDAACALARRPANRPATPAEYMRREEP